MDKAAIAARVARAPVTWGGRLMYYLLPYRKKVIQENIAHVFADILEEPLQRHLAQAFYTHLLRSLREGISLRFLTTAQLRRRVTVRGHEIMLNVAAQGKGVLVLTGHFGNWEFAPLGGILNFQDFQGQFHFIRRTLGGGWLERLLFSRYYRYGLQVIPKKNSLDKVCAALEQNHAVVFVLDQHASVVNRDGIAVEFFGRKAGTYRSLATLARYTGVPVVPAAGYRDEDGRHVLAFYPPILWQDYDDRQEGLYENTRRYNEVLEQLILQHPEQWLWLHRRWKLSSS